MRRNPDGTPEQTYGGNRLYSNGDPWKGFYELDPVGRPPYSAATSLIALAHDKVLVGGYHRNRLMVMRLNAAGRPDRTFGADRRHGRTIANFGGRKCFCVAGGAMTRDHKRRILQVGYSTYPRKNRVATIALVRYRPNGKIDRSFYGNGKYFWKKGSASMAEQVVIDGHGRALVAGGTAIDGTGSFVLKRFLPNR